MKTRIELNIPSSAAIVSTLNFTFSGDSKPATDVTYGDSLPIITEDEPGTLNYFPLSISSEASFQSGFDKDKFFSATRGKKHGIILCRSFKITTEDGTSMQYSSPTVPSIAFIAALWDATEDPLMETVLYSCTPLSTAIALNSSPVTPSPLALDQDQASAWLDTTRSQEDRINLLIKNITKNADI